MRLPATDATAALTPKHWVALRAILCVEMFALKAQPQDKTTITFRAESHARTSTVLDAIFFVRFP